MGYLQPAFRTSTAAPSAASTSTTSRCRDSSGAPKACGVMSRAPSACRLSGLDQGLAAGGPRRHHAARNARSSISIRRRGALRAAVPPLQVHVDFAGGVLSQYYPYAEAAGWSVSGFPVETRRLADITSSLDWKNVRLGSTETPVATEDKVWTTPREVSAPVLEVPSPTYPGGGRMEMKPAGRELSLLSRTGASRFAASGGAPTEGGLRARCKCRVCPIAGPGTSMPRGSCKSDPTGTAPGASSGATCASLRTEIHWPRPSISRFTPLSRQAAGSGSLISRRLH